ncbi:putative cytosolic iron-sulfur protein assembly protein 1, partial [Staphylotrichum tortipilum]
ALTPITALAFHPSSSPSHAPLLLAAEDTRLSVYDAHTARLLARLDDVFVSQPIHGICVRPVPSQSGTGAEVLLWGGSSVAHISEAAFEALLEGGGVPKLVEVQAPDWVYDGCLFEGGKGVLVTAHNEILPFDVVATASGERIGFGQLASPSRPILYSARLCLMEEGTVLVAAGTVFGEIIVWKYFVGGEGEPPRWEVLYVFTGHEGSVFGVGISPEMELGGGRGRLLVSCSDDRTVRVWDLTERGASVVEEVKVEEENGGAKAALDEARETGFGNSEAKRENEGDKARCVAVAMGHVSRIWHVVFGRVKAGTVEVYSFGEDCSRQKWELDLDLERWSSGHGAEGRVGTLRHCSTSTCHSGKNIWSAAILNRPDREPLIATGGADGRIVVSGSAKGAGSASAHYEDVDLTLTFDEILQSLHGSAESTPPSKNTKHAFQRYAFLSDTTMAVTGSGRLFLATMGNPLTWEEVALPEATVADLRGYNVIKSPARDTLLLGSPSGKVYLFRKGEDVRCIATLPEKISDIILLDSPQNDAPASRPWSIIINVLGLGHATLLHFDPSSGIVTIDPRKIQLSEHYIVTSAVFCNTTLILGSRTGSVTVYTTDPDTHDFVPLTSRKASKLKDAITCILPIPGSNASSFLATCRDGKCRIYTLPPSGAPYPTLQHEISPPLNTLETAFFTTPNTETNESQLILHGFRGPNFLAYNDSTRAILASIPCGGAHRPFATVSRPNDPGQMRFVFSKARDLHVVSQSGEDERALRAGGHGREIKAVSAAPYSASAGGLVATAAEDTTIRIWHHQPNSNGPAADKDQMACLAILQSHSAGIQTLRWAGPDCLLSSAGSEELFVWRISRVASPVYRALAVVREAVWENDQASPSRDLRVVDFDVSPWPESSSISAADTFESGKLLVTMGLSDSSVRSYIYSPPPSPTVGDDATTGVRPPMGTFSLLASGRYTGACPTQVRYLRVAPPTIAVLTAFTDGHVAVWETTTAHTPQQPAAELRLVMSTRLHQNSIKALDLCLLPSPNTSTPTNDTNNNQTYFIATGGDDNALTLLTLAHAPSKPYTPLIRHRIPSAHAAALTGLSITRTTTGGATTNIATTSNDQRLKLWQVRLHSPGGRVGVKLVGNRYCAVADAGDLEVAGGRVVVGGVGVEVWDVGSGAAGN